MEAEPEPGEEVIMCYVYILLSKKDGELYIGSTPDLKKRIEKHNNGLVLVRDIVVRCCLFTTKHTWCLATQGIVKYI